MSEPLKPIGFWSYTRDDDARSRGRLSQLRTLLAEELQGKLGRAERVRIFQDAAAISYGSRWERQIGAALEECSFFIPIVTPGFLQSEWCCKELARFRGRQAAMGRDDLIFPLHYIDVSDVNPDRPGDVHDRAAWDCIREQQMMDFRALRFEQPESSVAVARQLDALAHAIRGALRREVAVAVPVQRESAASAVDSVAPAQSDGVDASEAPAGAAPASDPADYAAAAAAADTPAPGISPPAQPVVRTGDTGRREAAGRSGGPAEQPRHRGLAMALPAALLLAVFGGIGWYWFGPTTPPPTRDQSFAQAIVPAAPSLAPPPALPQSTALAPAPATPATVPAAPHLPPPASPQSTPVPATPAPATATIPTPPEATVATTSPAPGSVIRDCPTCPEMVLVPSGRFTMGVPPGEDVRDGEPYSSDDGARPQHTVIIAHAFYMGKFAVTRGEFAAYVAQIGGWGPARGCVTFEQGKDGKWSSAERSDRNWQNPGFPQTDRDPVVCVSAQDADEYATWLTRETVKLYHLPTEAEWEYAARAVTTTGPTPARYWGDDFEHKTACRYANVADEAYRRIHAPSDKSWIFQCDDGYPNTSPVGSFQPNAFGLYDILGNAWQWTVDCYVRGYNGAPDDGSTRKSVPCWRVLRGGSWLDPAKFVRAGVRYQLEPRSRFAWAGFRVVRLQ